MNFQTASINWQKSKKQYIESKSEPLLKTQMNMLIPDMIRDEITEYIKRRRNEIETKHSEAERSRLALEFERNNPSPHSKDY